MQLVDVHAHSLPRIYLDAMHAAGVHDVEGWALPTWSEDGHLAMLESNEIAAAILSISAPGIGFAEGEAARGLARRINEDAAARRDRTGGRLGAFAVLTLPDVDGALRELEYALDTLKLDGIGLLTNTDGVYLGNPAFDPVLAEADRRGAVIYVHPVAPPGFKNFSLGFSASSIEYPFDTTRMVLNMVACGTFRRFKKLSLIVSHGGGTIPFLAWRMANVAAIFNRLDPPLSPDEVTGQLRSIWYDTTAIANPVSLASYLAFVPPEKRLYGSDTPFMPEISAVEARTTMFNQHTVPAEHGAALQHGNALALFPRLSSLLSAPGLRG